jgi:hypothetical protein
MTGKSALSGIPWQDGVLEEFDLLGRWFRGRFATGIDPRDKTLPARSLLDPGMLRQMIIRSVSTTPTPPGEQEPEGQEPGEQEAAADPGDALGAVELGAAVSTFGRHYALSLTAVAVVGLSRGIALDLSIDR